MIVLFFHNINTCELGKTGQWILNRKSTFTKLSVHFNVLKNCNNMAVWCFYKIKEPCRQTDCLQSFQIPSNIVFSKTTGLAIRRLILVLSIWEKTCAHFSSLLFWHYLGTSNKAVTSWQQLVWGWLNFVLGEVLQTNPSFFSLFSAVHLSYFVLIKVLLLSFVFIKLTGEMKLIHRHILDPQL